MTRGCNRPVRINSQLLMFLLRPQERFLESAELPRSKEDWQQGLGSSPEPSSHPERIARHAAGEAGRQTCCPSRPSTPRSPSWA